MSCHSFARTLMDETGYGAGGRWRVRLPLGVSSPRMSLIGWPRRTLDCRHGEAVLAVEPGARRREYRVSGSSRRPPCLARERDGDVASTMRGIGRASEGDRGLPADCVRPKGSIGVGAVCDHDAGPFGAVGVAGRDQDHPCGDGGDGRLLEAGLARAVPRLQPGSRQRLAHPQRAGPQERRQRRDLDRRPSRPRADPRQFRAAAADPGPARPDPHAARADARDRPSHPADSGDAGGGQHQAGLGHFRHPGLERPAHLEGDRVGPKRPAAAGRTRPSPARLHARGTRRRVGRTLARPSSLPDRSASEDDRTDLRHNSHCSRVLVAPECPALECGLAKGGCAMARQEILDRIQKYVHPFRVTKGKGFQLKDFDPGDTRGLKMDKAEAAELLQRGTTWLAEEQDMLYAQNCWSLLLVFQAMDAAGKDGTIKHVMSGVNPQGCQVVSFKQPSSEDLDHDFMWRYMRRLPERGQIGIFNRSYYEEVLVVRVHEEILKRQQLPPPLISKRIWDERLEDIAHIEDYLNRQGTIVLKFFLNLAREEQKKRFMQRLERPEKNWKFSGSDVHERKFWDEYMRAFEEAIRATASEHAPWYVVPADNKWFTRLVVAAAIVETVEELDLTYPKVDAQKKKQLELARADLASEAS